MPRPRRITAVALLFALPFGLIAPPSEAQTAVIDISNLIQNILQTLRQLREIQHMIEQLQTMRQNLESFDVLSFRDIQGWLLYLNGLARQGQALSYSLQNVFSQFQELFPGYAPVTSPTFDVLFQNWTRRTLDTLAATLDSASAQSSDYATTQSQLASIRGFATLAEGNLEALQASNMFQAHIAQEVAKLNQLLAADLNAQNVYFGHRLNLEANQDATHRWVLANTVRPFPAYGSGHGSNGIPARWPYPCPTCSPRVWP